MMLFDLESDPGEQHDIAGQHPELVRRLKNLFDEMNAQLPEFQEPRSDYLFRGSSPGASRPLMHLIGGELRYDRIPAWQQHLISD